MHGMVWDWDDSYVPPTHKVSKKTAEENPQNPSVWTHITVAKRTAITVNVGEGTLKTSMSIQ